MLTAQRWKHKGMSVMQSSVMLTIVWIVIVLTCGGAPATAQDGPKECLERIKEIYRVLAVPPEDGCLINYTLNVKNSEGQILMPPVSVDLAINSRRMRYVSNQIEVYRDSAYTISLMPGTKVVRITDGGMATMRDSRIDLALTLQDSLFDSLIPLTCTEVAMEGGVIHRRFVGLLDTAMRQSTRIDSMCFVLSGDDKSLHSIEVHQAVDGGAVTELVFHTLSCGNADAALDAPMTALFFGSG